MHRQSPENSRKLRNDCCKVHSASRRKSDFSYHYELPVYYVLNRGVQSYELVSRNYTLGL